MRGREKENKAEKVLNTRKTEGKGENEEKKNIEDFGTAEKH